MDVIIGCVGKPSAGKSTFFNAVTDGKAKTGNFPFTTIEPNEGITYFMSQCPCVAKNKSSVCQPRYGKCVQGTRYIPIKLLDVAGLIPGASEGAGLGNKFLDDLRHANVLMHIIDVSGRTNEKGEVRISCKVNLRPLIITFRRQLDTTQSMMPSGSHVRSILGFTQICTSDGTPLLVAIKLPKVPS